MKYIMALDAGTTSNRCIIFDENGNVCAGAQKEFRQYYPKPGWVEHDAEEIWSTMYSMILQAMKNAGVSPGDIAAIGITNQRETTVIWDRKTGVPVCNAIVWQCRRTVDAAKELTDGGYTEMIREKTGLMPDAYFSATKIRWILDNIDGVRERAECGDLAFGTIDSWLIWKLSGGALHITDCSNASRTMLFNIHTLEWDRELLDLLDIPESLLPSVMPSSCIYGTSDPSLFGAPIPIAAAAGDQQSALFGQTCFSKGDVKNTYGTGGFLLMNTGDSPVTSDNGLVSSIAWKIGDKVSYALEGSVFVAGAAIQWLRDELKILDSAPDSEYMACKEDDTNGCYVVPAFTGLGAPYWDPYARGTIVGLTRGCNKYHIIRATLDSLAYQVNDVIDAMKSDSGTDISFLAVDGGAAANNLLCQRQADISGLPVVRPVNVETTALGAAYLAGLAAGIFKDLDELRSRHEINRTFTPSCDEETRKRDLSGWRRAVKAARVWGEEE